MLWCPTWDELKRKPRCVRSHFRSSRVNLEVPPIASSCGDLLSLPSA